MKRLFWLWCRFVKGHDTPKGKYGYQHCRRCGIPMFVVSPMSDDVFKASPLFNKAPSGRTRVR